ncbi:MAG: ABC transporter ATP-binding protein [Acidobacteriota bacterium]
MDLESVAWPVSSVGEGVELLARKRRLVRHSRVTSLPVLRPADAADPGAFARWIDGVAAELGVEIEPVAASYAEVDQFVRAAAPALVRLPAQGHGDALRFLVVIKRVGRHLSVLGPDLQARRVPCDAVRDVLCHEIEASVLDEADRLLDFAGTPAGRRSMARSAIAREAVARRGDGASPIGSGWLLRLAAGAGLRERARHEGFWGLLSRDFGIILLQHVFELAAWIVLARSALSSTVEKGWLWAWALLLLTAAVCRMPAQHLRGALRRKIMGVKLWLLHRALTLDPDAVRHQGTGQFLGSIMAAGLLEDGLGNYTVMVLMSVVKILTIAALLAFGAGGWIQASLLVGCTALTLLMGWRYLRRGSRWSAAYHHMTGDLVERMVGHQTRLIQEGPEQWHTEEDAILDHYVQQSESLDRVEAQLRAFTTRGWMVIGLAGLAYPFIMTEPSVASMLTGVGGILLASAALESLAQDMFVLAQGMLAWQQVKSLTATGTVRADAVSFSARPSVGVPDATHPLLVARDLSFRFFDRGRPILRECSLQIRPGDHLLLEGPSGGGKSTLGSLFAGLRQPNSGLVLLKGLDLGTVGPDQWRRSVVMVPQFHENHVFTETIAFNLLMGRHWPPGPDDLARAEAVCRELGLGDLLDRMPAGLDQPVGGSGWQLSHGEASRVYLGRALLQDSELVIVDETFGTLDASNLRKAMQCLLDRAPTLMVIAHP